MDDSSGLIFLATGYKQRVRVRVQRSIELFFSINQPIKQQIQTHRVYGIVKNTALLYYHDTPDTHSVGTTHTQKKVRMSFPRNGVKGTGVGAWGGGGETK